MTTRIAYQQIAPDAVKMILPLEHHVRTSGLESSLRHLVKLRASYLNGCAYCVDMHSKDARHDGESERRLFAVPVWRETPFFTDRERAALRWTEVVTEIGRAGMPNDVYEAAREHFSEIELVNLTMAVIAINAWNRLAITFGTEVGPQDV